MWAYIISLGQILGLQVYDKRRTRTDIRSYASPPYSRGELCSESETSTGRISKSGGSVDDEADRENEIALISKFILEGGPQKESEFAEGKERGSCRLPLSYLF